MNDEERYLFDLQGYLSIPGALDAAALARMNSEIEVGIANEAASDVRTHRFHDGMALGPAFREQVDNSAVARILTDIIGADFRLDHAYADVIRAGDGPIGTVLHGGAVPYRPSEYYHTAAGSIHSGLVAVAFNLKDVGPTDGGFGCVPSSHKSSFAFPVQWKNLSDTHPCVRRVTGAAGTAIVFAEAMVHGTLPWRGADERRTAFFKYSPAAVAWSAEFYDSSAYPELTARQRALLEPPNARYRGRPTAPLA